MKVERLVSIIMILLNKKKVNAKELAEMFEVSLRTIYRDIEAINAAGIPIHTTPGVNGGIEILDTYKVDKNVFSNSDLASMVLGLSSLSNMTKDDSLSATLAKIKSFIPPNQINEIEQITSQILIDFSSWEGNSSDSVKINSIKDAITNHRVLSFNYIGNGGKHSSRNVEPYKLIYKGRHWYLYSYCLTKNESRLFRISRINNLQSSNVSFTPREMPLPQMEYREILNQYQISISLRIEKSITDMVMDYCDFEYFHPEDDNHYLVDFPFIDNDYHYNILMGFGSKCEVLAPDNIRQKMIGKITELTSVYN